MVIIIPECPCRLGSRHALAPLLSSIPRHIPRSSSAQRSSPEAWPPSLLAWCTTWCRRFRMVIVRRRRVVVTSASAASAPSSPRIVITSSSYPNSSSIANENRVDHPPDHTNKDPPKHESGPLYPLAFVPIEQARTTLSVPLFPELRKHKPVFHSTAAFQHVRILGGLIPLADHVCGTEFEFCGQGGGACPLDVLGVVVGALVFAA